MPGAARGGGVCLAKAVGAIEALLEQGYSGPAGGRGTTSPYFCLEVPWWYGGPRPFSSDSIVISLSCVVLLPLKSPAFLISDLSLSLSLSSSPANVCIPSPILWPPCVSLLLHTPSFLPQADRAQEPLPALPERPGFSASIPPSTPTPHPPPATCLAGSFPSLGLEV